jgi:diguanylate cyclase (GGDEF)-like protein
VEDANGKVLSYVAAIADLSHRDENSEQLTQLAYHDALTGLPNRRMLEDRLLQAITDSSREGCGLCVLYLDLDRFKPVNDELGHDVGDLVLQEVGARLKAAVRSGDTVARVGGDEFVIVLQSTSPVHDAESIASGILNALNSPIRAGYHTVSIGASIGCAIYPHDGQDAAALLKHADAAMYGAKRFGTQFSFYETGSETPTFNLGFEIWQALERNEMHLVYQPQVRSVAQGRLRGCEALLRWNHSTLGEISPSTFIPIAEKNGAIVLLGSWVLLTACKQLRQWQSQGVNDFTMSVNVSLRQLRDPNFVTYLSGILAESGIASEYLELELSETESLLYQDEDRLHIEAVRKLGVKIAIDDFGVAFSSLAKLHSLSISSLKINPQFVKDLAESADARAISNCMVAIGVAMGIEVIAEGVESAEQLAVLSAQGCHVTQGYWTGHPMLAAELLHRTLGVVPA